MKLKPIQLSILIFQIAALVLNLYAIFVKGVEDSSSHWVGVLLLIIIMSLSIKSWYDTNTNNGTDPI